VGEVNLKFKMTKNIKILAIESSCDETAAAVIGERDGAPVILSNIISSQVDLHAKTGGVVPEVASRAHMEAVVPVISEALQNITEKLKDEKHAIIDHQEAIKTLQDDITHLAVTVGPGLIGSLMVGVNAAKTLSFSLQKPIIPINHIEGHIYSALASEKSLNDQINEKWSTKNGKLFPVLALTVSGGHTSLTLMKDHGVYEEIGSTLDDAVGEAYDKVAKLLNLGYPGGPIVSKLAAEYRQMEMENEKWKMKNIIVFPRPIIKDGTYNFSFSGLKTAVLTKVKELTADGGEIKENEVMRICAAFEEAVKDVLATKLGRAIDQYGPKAVIFAGGVSANKYLRDSLKQTAEEKAVSFLTPAPGLYGDNAAMIGLAAFYHIKRADLGRWDKITVNSGLELC
jgi:N6-L-threonylcarbamoyladenine synthase